MTPMNCTNSPSELPLSLFPSAGSLHQITVCGSEIKSSLAKNAFKPYHTGGSAAANSVAVATAVANATASAFAQALAAMNGACSCSPTSGASSPSVGMTRPQVLTPAGLPAVSPGPPSPIVAGAAKSPSLSPPSLAMAALAPAVASCGSTMTSQCCQQWDGKTTACYGGLRKFSYGLSDLFGPRYTLLQVKW